MVHLTELELIDLAAGRMASGRAAVCREHLSVCPQCRVRLDEAAGVWEATGLWTAAPTAESLAAAVVDRAGRSIRPAPQRRLWAAVRFAAMLAIAVGVGHLAGRASWSGIDPVAVDAETAADSLVLYAWPGEADWAESIITSPEIEENPG